MDNDKPRVVWDSCVIIDAIQKTEHRYDLIEPFVAQAEDGQLDIVISEVSVAEVKTIKGSRNKLTNDEAAELIQRWLENPFIHRINVHPGISGIAAQIGRIHNLKRAADALVIATAIFEEVPVVHTFDGEGGKKKSMLSLDGKVGTPPLTIMVPDPASGTLWGSYR